MESPVEMEKEILSMLDQLKEELDRDQQEGLCPLCDCEYTDVSQGPACTVIPETYEHRHCFIPVAESHLLIIEHKEDEDMKQLDEDEAVSIDID